MDPSAPEKRARAAAVLEAGFQAGSLVTSPQTLNECYRVLTERRRLAPPDEARTFVRTFALTCSAPLDWTTIELAWSIADRRRYGWWDCLMLSSALAASCTLFLTEDLTHGDTIETMRIVDPFRRESASLLS